MRLEYAMQRCPKCGYRDRVDWPAILWRVAFGLLYSMLLFEFYFGCEHLPRTRSYRLVELVVGSCSCLLFGFGDTWKRLRDKRDRNEYLKQDPSPTERVKNHIKPQTSSQ
jgi:hypothetical protein